MACVVYATMNSQAVLPQTRGRQGLSPEVIISHLHTCHDMHVILTGMNKQVCICTHACTHMLIINYNKQL